MTNRLASEKSPYLKQHENNPVDWYPWKSETLKLAKDEKKTNFSKCWLCQLSLVSCYGS